MSHDINLENVTLMVKAEPVQEYNKEGFFMRVLLVMEQYRN